MSSCYGENIKMTIFGQSHSKAIGVTLEGIPAGEFLDMEELRKFLSRRAPGQNEYSTSRKETDEPEFLCGLVDNVTCGAPITAIIRNNDTRPGDYEQLSHIPRPGHADYTAYVKYEGHQDYSGGGHFSGRLTAPLCIAGGICKQLLKRKGIDITAKIISIGSVKEDEEKMFELISKAKEKGDSVGGVIECEIAGVPAGLGDPMFGGMENRISAIVFGIPAVKGIEFGLGFRATEIFGSENNDAFCIEDGAVKTCSNNAGGILGGITNGMPIMFRTAIKPTPSISIPQKSVDLKAMQETEIVVKGRHDPCIVPRALPCIEAAAAIAVYDALLGRVC